MTAVCICAEAPDFIGPVASTPCQPEELPVNVVLIDLFIGDVNVAVSAGKVAADSPLITVLALVLVLTFGAAYANLKLPYLVFVTLLTPAVVLQTSDGSRAIVPSTIERAGFTLAGAALAIIVLTIRYFAIVNFRKTPHARHEAPAAAETIYQNTSRHRDDQDLTI